MAGDECAARGGFSGGLLGQIVKPGFVPKLPGVKIPEIPDLSAKEAPVINLDAMKWLNKRPRAGRGFADRQLDRVETVRKEFVPVREMERQPIRDKDDELMRRLAQKVIQRIDKGADSSAMSRRYADDLKINPQLPFKNQLFARAYGYEKLPTRKIDMVASEEGAKRAGQAFANEAAAPLRDAGEAGRRMAAPVFDVNQAFERNINRIGQAFNRNANQLDGFVDRFSKSVNTLNAALANDINFSRS